MLLIVSEGKIRLKPHTPYNLNLLMGLHSNATHVPKDNMSVVIKITSISNSDLKSKASFT